MDTRGKSDPFVVVYRKVDTNAAREDWVKLGQTETVYNDLFPKWSTTFSLEYRFGTNFLLRFSIYDRDSKDDDLSKQDYIGEVRCTIAQIVLADNQTFKSQVTKPGAKTGAKTGFLTIRSEEEKGDLGDSVTLQFAARALRRARKPFYVLSRKNANDSNYSPVMYSEVHQGYSSSSQVTTFKPITKSLAKLVNGDLDRELQVQFMDYDRWGKHYRGGCATFTLRAAKTAISSATTVRYPLVKKKTNGNLVDAGTLLLKKCEVSVPYSFLDYIRSGTNINLVVAVDMSATNGDPADPSSLHYNNRRAPNEYVIALQEVGNVLAAYDTSGAFPAFGFGATLPPSFKETAHIFALTGNIMQPVCHGVEGVVEMYYNALNNVGPYVPCHYAPVLEHVIRMVREENTRTNGAMYTVLLLVTDGDFSDFPQVANLICSAADLPLSIVIVGVGNSRFVKLERLDGDNTPLCSTDGTPCARDIVQFVQFHNHRYDPKKLAKEVLDEIPDQLVSYMRSKGIKPGDITPGPSRQPRRAPPSNPRGQPAGPYIPASRQISSPHISLDAIPTTTMHFSPPTFAQQSSHPISYAQPTTAMHLSQPTFAQQPIHASNPLQSQQSAQTPGMHPYHMPQPGAPASPYSRISAPPSYHTPHMYPPTSTPYPHQVGVQPEHGQYQPQSGVMNHQVSYSQPQYQPPPPS